MKTSGALALVVTTIACMAPLAEAEERDQFRPAYELIMVGVNVPENKDFNGGSECMFVWGRMRNPHFGWQIELGEVVEDATLDTGFFALGGSIKLAVPVAFAEPYVLGGVSLSVGDGGLGFPLQAAIGIDLNFGKVVAGVEVRRVWLTVDERDKDALLVMGKGGVRF
jgi:hypothetical protein